MSASGAAAQSATSGGSAGTYPAGQERRVALVIGNAAYKQAPLTNPINDARAMAARLRALGFDVTLRENVKTREIGGIYRDFRSKISPGSVALLYYAGHGLQVKGQNYFPSVDSDISSEEDVPLNSLHLGTFLDNMEESKAGVSLVFLDACRDNPFARRFRSASRGLAKVEAASGTLMHYATKPGSVAADGEGPNGTYTEALLAQIGDADVPVEIMLKRVTNRVVAKTSGRQEPWVEGSLRGDFYFRSQNLTTAPGAQSVVAAAASIRPGERELAAVIESAKEPGPGARKASKDEIEEGIKECVAGTKVSGNQLLSGATVTASQIFMGTPPADAYGRIYRDLLKSASLVIRQNDPQMRILIAANESSRDKTKYTVSVTPTGPGSDVSISFWTAPMMFYDVDVAKSELCRMISTAFQD